MTIQAITFDFWDTLAVDDSDEPRRAAQGLLPKPAARRGMVVEEFLGEHHHLTRGEVGAAWDQANALCRSRWLEDLVTPSVAERVDLALGALALARTPGFDDLVSGLEAMEVEIPPVLAPHVAEVLPELAKRFRLGIISDTIVTPGRGLRAILAGHGLVSHFEVFVFSDEVGRAKPHRDVFQSAIEGFGVAPGSIAHVGDREVNDVRGPQGHGLKGVLYTGVVDRTDGDSCADVVYGDHRALAGLLEAL